MNDFHISTRTNGKTAPFNIKMKNTNMKPPLFLILLFSISTMAQRRSELLAEIDTLKNEKQSLEQQLAESKREISSSKAKAETLENENIGLRDANASLLKNLTSFSELSKKNAENVNKTLQALAQKEKQLNGITDIIAANDSTAVVLLTEVKQILGDGGNADFLDGDIVISNSLDTLFGSDTGTEPTKSGMDWAARLIEIIKANPNREIEVVGLNITGEFGITYDQANAMAKTLTGSEGISVEKLSVSVKDGNFKEGIRIKIKPDYEEFYRTVKENVKVAQ